MTGFRALNVASLVAAALAAAPGCGCQLQFTIAPEAQAIPITLPVQQESIPLLASYASLVSVGYVGDNCPSSVSLADVRLTSARAELVVAPASDRIMLGMVPGLVNVPQVAVAYDNGALVITPKQVASVSLGDLMAALHGLSGSVSVTPDQAAFVSNGRRTVSVTVTDDRGCTSAPAVLSADVSGGGGLAWSSASTTGLSVAAAIVAAAVGVVVAQQA
jgi:hypothetical protein